VTARYKFEKSWGAEILAGGGARFRLWAPNQQRIALQVEESGAELPMQRSEDGWFAIETDAVSVDRGYMFLLDDGFAVPDPASRAQCADVHGPSRLVDPGRYAWRSADWLGRPWEETVLYELHVGAFTDEGTFDAACARLDHLVRCGVTAVELMPVAQFGGRRGWGYDGVYLYAPHEAYGGPEGLKTFIDAAHERGIMVFLDVIYNHFGPDGSYLHLYAPDFFHQELHTPWGGAIAYEKAPVRAFFFENALYWLEEFRFDGLRLDAVDHIARHDHSEPPFLEELARIVRTRLPHRHVHLTTEDDRNVAHLHSRDSEGRPTHYTAEWNDDFHHAAHAAATGESIGYYSDYADRAVFRLARSLASGYVYQGEPSAFRGGRARGESSEHLPPATFVNFLQNHDQIGNRAYSERLTSLADPKVVEALTVVLLLAPQIPLLFMGEEWGETRCFGYFTDFHGDLGRLVREGRRREFEKWPHFASDEHSALIADPNVEATFHASRLDWNKLATREHAARLAFVRDLIGVRAREIVPLISLIGGHSGLAEMLSEDAFLVTWRPRGGGRLCMTANFGEDPMSLPQDRARRILFAYGEGSAPAYESGSLLPGAVISACDPAKR
jgi:malto-oligosyltrehalose trehalohydrolase